MTTANLWASGEARAVQLSALFSNHLLALDNVSGDDFNVEFVGSAGFQIRADNADGAYLVSQGTDFGVSERGPWGESDPDYLQGWTVGFYRTHDVVETPEGYFVGDDFYTDLTVARDAAGEPDWDHGILASTKDSSPAGLVLAWLALQGPLPEVEVTRF